MVPRCAKRHLVIYDRSVYFHCIKRSCVLSVLNAPVHKRTVVFLLIILRLFLAELALVTHKPRAASAYAIGTARLAGLSVYLFTFMSLLFILRLLRKVSPCHLVPSFANDPW